MGAIPWEGGRRAMSFFQIYLLGLREVHQALQRLLPTHGDDPTREDLLELTTQNAQYQVGIGEDLRKEALRPIERILAIGCGSRV